MIALVSVIVAYLAYRSTRKATRRRATLDMVMKTLMDNDVQEEYRKFRDLIRKDQDSTDPFDMTAIATANAVGNDDRNTVLQQLNIYELMALGIRRGLFDEALYKRWYHNQFMMDYEGVSELIDALQSNKSSIYCEASALYKSWARNGHPESSPGRLRMAWWSLSGKNDKIDAARAMANAR